MPRERVGKTKSGVDLSPRQRSFDFHHLFFPPKIYKLIIDTLFSDLLKIRSGVPVTINMKKSLSESVMVYNEKEYVVYELT